MCGKVILPLYQENESWVTQLCCPPKDLVMEVNRVISEERDEDMKNNFGLSKTKPDLSGHDAIYWLKDCSGVRHGDTYLWLASWVKWH